MSGSEDYLDGLLNSINKVKSDAEQAVENSERNGKEIVESRKTVAPDQDFFAATGIDVQQTNKRTSHPYLRKVLSEEDFLRKFEEELDDDDPDAFISAFEQEIDEEEAGITDANDESFDVVDKLISNIDNEVIKANKELEASEEIKEQPADESREENLPVNEADNVSDEVPSDNEEDNTEISLDEDIALPDDEDIDLSEFIETEDEKTDIDESSEDDGESGVGLSLDDMLGDDEEPVDESMKEFMPDEMDALDEVEYGDGEEPDLSGEGELDLDNLLGDDEDLLDIQSILNGDEEGPADSADIDESAEEKTEEPEEEGGKKKRGRKKDKKEKKENGEKQPNPIIQKILLILFGPPDEDELAEEAAKEAKKNTTVEITYDEDGNPIIPDGAEEDPKEKKKREKEEKKAAKEAAKKEKEAAKKEKEKEKKPKPAKPPKPKKEKKPKEPDNSPKIPISIIATFLVLSISIIGVVMVGMTFTGIKRHMAEASELFEAGDYIAAYEKLNGFDMSDEKVALMRNQARTLADLQQCQDEYVAFIGYEMYDYALDSLIKGLGRYEKYKDDAEEYGISEQYEAYGQQIISELQDTFGLSVDEAMAIYKQPNRHYYTIELRKVLRGLGLPDT